VCLLVVVAQNVTAQSILFADSTVPIFSLGGWYSWSTDMSRITGRGYGRISERWCLGAEVDYTNLDDMDLYGIGFSGEVAALALPESLGVPGVLVQAFYKVSSWGGDVFPDVCPGPLADRSRLSRPL